MATSVAVIKVHVPILLDDIRTFMNQNDSEWPLFDDWQCIDENEDDNEGTPPVTTRIPVVKHKPRVAIPGKEGLMYKSTLVSLLNEDPNLSHDRYVLFTIWVAMLYLIYNLELKARDCK